MFTEILEKTAVFHGVDVPKLVEIVWKIQEFQNLLGILANISAIE